MRYKNRIICLCLVLSVNIGLTYAKPPSHSTPIICQEISTANNPFNHRLVTLLKKWQIPGASVSVMKNNKMILSCGYGWANILEDRHVQPKDLFRLGSVSKTITALAILKLAEQNKLNLNHSVYHLLSNLMPLDNLIPNPKIYQITIRNLLQMSSGWYTDRPQDADPMLGPWSRKMLQQLHDQVPPSCNAAARMMMSMPLQFQPGTKYSYSNLNYCLLGLTINHISKQYGAAGYESFIKQTLLSPIGIEDMQIGSTQTQNKAPNEVTYYAQSDKGAADGLPYSSMETLKKNYADGGWIASSSDLVKLLQAFHDGKILNSNFKNIMIERPFYSKEKLEYHAMGWDKIKFTHGKRYISKTGSFTGTQALILQSSDGTSYAALFNMEPSNRKQFIDQLKKLLLQINTTNRSSPQNHA